MNIGIVFAMESELEAYVKISNKVSTNNNIFTYVCGIGKVNAATTTTKAICDDKIDLVINCGIAGGINSAHFLDVIYATQLKYSDVDVTMFDYEIGQIPKMPVYYQALKNTFNLDGVINGKIASQDTFATDSAKKFFEEFYGDFMAIDMESCAIAQTSYNFNKDFIVIRAISDLVFESNNHLDFKEKEKLACAKAANTLVELLNQI